MSEEPLASVVPVVDEQQPWLGLLPFTEKTRRFFFGRDAEIAEISDRIAENPLTVLFGQSGLGKTSLLRAGVVPRWTRSPGGTEPRLCAPQGRTRPGGHIPCR